ncbi:DUF6626 family protein [Azospirillum brasilense]|uniref:DUF6626 family protein n=1 Tax=Azospirillum brasilense TaxID=192 RepID=UPI003D7C7097
MLENIYNELVKRNLIKSRRAFSKIYLCRASNYLCDAKIPSAKTLSFLHTRLMQNGQDDLALQVLLMIFDQAHEELSKKTRRAR